ncbi:MAG: CDP-diacylglycerol--glycerol-3-phosphate 3-phosphatidyltransferase [Gammaproteobacteria bacterium]|nr:CDP-diacylglycerol--glycerol-3-phosphate 3-phosphatidyltransferase [Gammaproteobacteria bacterium]
MQRLINFLTISRMFLALMIYCLLVLQTNYILAICLFFLAGMSDYLDGFFARKYNATSQLGEILDPIADKILILFLLFGLAINLSSILIGFIGSIIISREIWVSALRDLNARNNNKNATKVTYLAKIKTTIQLFTIGIYLLGLATNTMLLIVIADIFLIISLLITLYTGYQYTKASLNN